MYVYIYNIYIYIYCENYPKWVGITVYSLLSLHHFHQDDPGQRVLLGRALRSRPGLMELFGAENVGRLRGWACPKIGDPRIIQLLLKNSFLDKPTLVYGFRLPQFWDTPNFVPVCLLLLWLILEDHVVGDLWPCHVLLYPNHQIIQWIGSVQVKIYRKTSYFMGKSRFPVDFPSTIRWIMGKIRQLPVFAGS